MERVSSVASAAVRFRLRRNSSVERTDFGEVSAGSISIQQSRAEKQLELGRSATLRTRGGDLHLSVAFASGQVYSATLLDKLLAESFYNPRIVDVVNLVAHGDDEGNRLHSLAVPPALLKRSRSASQAEGQDLTFGELFEYFVLTLHVVPIGLYRARGRSVFCRFQYVYTNPAHDTVVDPRDAVYAVGCYKPQGPLNWGGRSRSRSRDMPMAE